MRNRAIGIEVEPVSEKRGTQARGTKRNGMINPKVKLTVQTGEIMIARSAADA